MCEENSYLQLWSNRHVMRKFVGAGLEDGLGFKPVWEPQWKYHPVRWRDMEHWKEKRSAEAMESYWHSFIFLFVQLLLPQFTSLMYQLILALVCSLNILYIYIILHFCGHLLERRIPPDSSSSPKTCGCLPWVFGKVFRPSGWTDRVQTTNFCFCRLFGPDGAPKGGEGGGKGVVLVRPSAIDFLRLKHYKDFFWDFQAATLVLESRPVWVFLVVPC